MKTSGLSLVKDLVTLAAVIGFAAAAGFLAVPRILDNQSLVLKTAYIDEQKKVVQEAVENSRERILSLVSPLKAAGFPLSKTKELILSQLEKERYGVNGYGYFLVADEAGIILMHSMDHSLVTKNLSEIRTPTGNNLGQIFGQVSGNGSGGFVEYDWTVPGTNRVERKTTYVLEIPQLSWTIASGFYHSDVATSLDQFTSITQKTIRDLGLTFTAYLAAFILLLALLSVVIHRRILATEKALMHQIKVLGQYKLILDKSSMVIRTDANRIIVAVNDTYCEVSGFSQEQVIGQREELQRHPDTPLEVCRDLSDTISQGGVWTGILKNRRADGTGYIKRTTIVPIADDRGRTLEFLSSGQNITELVEKRRELNNAFNTDPLTGLGSRIRLLKDLETAWNPGVVLVDIENFSGLNLSFGPQVGDSVLQQTALRVLEFSRSRGATAYRIQGDIFALRLGAEPSVFRKFIDDLVEDLKGWTFVLGGNPSPLIFHLGCADLGRDSFLYADMALKRAKETGKLVHRYRPGEPGTPGDSLANLEVLNQITLALKNNRIYPVFQPILDLSTGKVAKYECLMRLDDDRQGTLLPDEFIEISKKTNLYQRLTMRIIERSIEAFQDTDQEFSVNLTIEDLLNSETIAFLVSEARRHGVADRLIVEIVETEELHDLDRAETALATLRAEGMRIAVDDFGSGYSNFDYLLKLNPSFVKIDKVITQNILKDDRARGLLQSVVQFARSSGMKTIAEYIDSPALLEEVRAIGVDYVQGWLVGKAERDFAKEGAINPGQTRSSLIPN